MHFPKNILNTLKFKYFISARTLGYTQDYIELFYKIYLNHSKVIHYRHGYPVYSISTPALYSKPMANLVARGFYRSVQNKNLPNLLSFAVNDDCNAGCAHCSFYQGVADKKRKVVTTDQAIGIIKSAQELGTTVINFVGGEPLMRSDITEIIGAVDKDLSCTALFTNGWFLEERAEALAMAGLDGVYVSIDSADGKTHDDIRKKPGLFNKAVAGIKSSKAAGMTTGISAIMTKERFRSGELDRLVMLCRKLGVHEMVVFDAIPTGRLGNRTDLNGYHQWIDEMIKTAQMYNKSAENPGILIYAYTTSHRAVGCNCGTSYCYVSPYGDMMPCDFNHFSFGNVLTEPFYQVWEKLSSSKHFCTASWGGCKMKNEQARIGGYAKIKQV
jgi:MoaA/NifB/PqqE/SkfB family radical SAM enzyme